MTPEELRQIDALVAEALGLEVLGEAWCWNPGGGGWDIHLWADESEDGGTYGVLRPVWLGHCLCDYYANDSLAQEIAEFETKRYGHYRQCLEMVSHYTTNWSAASQVVEWMRKYDFDLSLHVWHKPRHVWARFTRTEGDRGYSDAPDVPEAICLAFLAAMGVEVE